MSLFWGFCPNLLNSAQILRLLHCCHVVSDELSVNVWWVGYTLMHWQSLRERETWSMLTMPGLSLWDCDCHGELFSHVSFSIGSLDLYCWRRQESWRSDQKETWGWQKKGSQLPSWHLLLPRVQTRCSLHIVTLNILKFCQGHPPSTSTLTAIHLRHRGDTERHL